ncbi:MAG: histidinol-phosphate transaminase [Clostridia bacterium]|nr:histidinol-phosphate transaminase [Clostridia bacterium]
MSKYFSKKYASLTPYTPGEQPKDTEYVKLNTNESPFAPPPSVVEAARAEGARSQLYSDPECSALVEKAAEIFGVKKTQVLPTNGSDEILHFAFMAFCDKDTPVVFPDITYGFYSVFAKLHSIPYKTIPLKADFSVDYRDYLHANATVVIANPNAPTGLCLPVWQIEEIVKANPDNIVVIDEAYVDFGGESCVSLVQKYDNLLVTQTFSKSRSLAGARLGLGFACESLIADLNAIKYSTNPYNVNRMTAAAGRAALCENAYFTGNCKIVCENRQATATALKELGFEVLDSKTNFLFVRSDKIGGRELYEKLKERGVLVRNFTGERIKDFNRVTIGTAEQMEIFLRKTKEILEEKANENSGDRS